MSERLAPSIRGGL